MRECRRGEGLRRMCGENDGAQLFRHLGGDRGEGYFGSMINGVLSKGVHKPKKVTGEVKMRHVEGTQRKRRIGGVHQGWGFGCGTIR